MKTAHSLAILLVFSGCGLVPAEKTTMNNFNHALAPVFEADMPSALARLAALPDSEMDAKQRQVRACMQARFGGTASNTALESLTGPASEVMGAYRRYWTASLMRMTAPEQAEATLSADLAPHAGSAAQDLAARAADAARLLEAQGLFVLGGVTPPLRELMLWRKQTVQVQTIELPGSRIDVTVTLLDDFASLGWAAWGTCDKRYTRGGWATDDGIMVVVPAWDLDSEAYRISLLAHEAQHFSDYRRYPKLSPPDLEYRAKLVELALSGDTQLELLEKFSTEAVRKRALPHSFASYWAIERIRNRVGSDHWQSAPVNAIRQAALAELASHSAALDETGRESVTTSLPD